MDKVELCPQCHGRGLILIDNETATPCSCTVQRGIKNKFHHAMMNKALLSCGFNTFKSQYYSKNAIDSNGRSYYENAAGAFKAAQKFARDIVKKTEADGIMFTGPVGSGKTFLASAIANALLEENIEVLFIVVPDLLDQLRATYGNSQDYTEHELMEAARRVHVLILDDLGAHNYTEWARNKIYSILNYRMNNRLPTVITTNLDLSELEDYLGERTTSRVIQMCERYRLPVETDIRIVKRQHAVPPQSAI